LAVARAAAGLTSADYNPVQFYASYQTALTQACATTITPALADFEITFAPVPPPPDNEWLSILLTIVDLVGTVAVSAFFNTRMFLVYPQLPLLLLPVACLCSFL
jgi:curli biogenesis system outer membrane secretion channel CsgG